MAEIKQVLVPDIGDFKDIPVIEVLVKPGDTVKAEDPLISLESDKATMEVPAPFAGIVREVSVKIGDKVTEGMLILTMEVAANSAAAAPATAAATAAPAKPAVATAPAPAPQPPLPQSLIEPLTTRLGQQTTPAKSLIISHKGEREAVSAPNVAAMTMDATHAKAHAGPSVRRFARELGVNLGLVKGSGPKQRILKEDVQSYVKAELSKPRGGDGAELNLLPWPQVNFAKFGPVEIKPLARIKKMAGANLHRNWVMIPHVTQFDEADITDLEILRKESNEAAKKDGVKVTMLAFLIKAAVAALKKFPEFNASLDGSNGENLVIKNYYHLGFAADTPHGLVVPVIRDADQKGVVAIAKELSTLSALAREGKLKPTEMQGASFTISSLGGIGGTAFTPIINAPEVAILGVSRSSLKPVYRDGQLVPRLMLPLSLSYDHRVIDGASAARFTTHLVEVLADMRRALL